MLCLTLPNIYGEKVNQLMPQIHRDRRPEAPALRRGEEGGPSFCIEVFVLYLNYEADAYGQTPTNPRSGRRPPGDDGAIQRGVQRRC